jgi:hypothetical protein
MTTSTSATSPPAGPQVQDHEVLGRDDVPMKIRGRLLGFASSQTDEHQFHPGEFARPGSRCSACRWFECRIFEVTFELSETCTCDEETLDSPSRLKCFRDRIDTHNDHAEDCGLVPARKPYLVLTYGLSDVPGEVDKRRASWTDSPFEIIELLTQRGREDRQAFLPAASARAVAQAANWSKEIQQAYVDRAVV